jgi:hypothetical protein
MPYKELVRPLDYDFGLVLGAEYVVIAIIERNGTLWMYVAPIYGDVELFLVPAGLFSFDSSAIPLGMVVRQVNSKRPSLEILPSSLSRINDWFERYVDDDALVRAVINREVDEMRCAVPNSRAS